MGSLLIFHLVKTISRTEKDNNNLGYTVHVFIGLWDHQSHFINKLHCVIKQCTRGYPVIKKMTSKGSLIIYGVGGCRKRKSPYLPRITLFSSNFFRTYYLAPKQSEMIDRLKFSPSLEDSSKIFQHSPLAIRLKFFASPCSDQKNEKYPKYPQNMKRLCFRNIEKN